MIKTLATILAFLFMLSFWLPAKASENDPALTIGLYGIGLDTYWGQFPGLYDRLQGYQQTIAGRIAARHPNIKIINTGIVDSPEKARATGAALARENVDLIFLYISTYALSSTVLPVVQALQVPVIVLSLQPTKAINYAQFNAMKDRGKMTGEWLAYCQACSAPEIACVFNRAKIDYHLITGTLDDELAWQEIDDWLAAAQVVQRLRATRIGIMGHYYGGMLDVYADKTQLSAVFGAHFEIVEIGQVRQFREAAPEKQVGDKIRQFARDFEVDPACSAAELRRAALTSIALDSLAVSKKLGCLAYYYEGIGDPVAQDIITSIIPGNTLLTMQQIPVAGEYEIKNVIAMKIMDLLGVGGSFSEFYALDLNDDIVLLGHDGPGHAKIADGKVKLVPLPVFHGKPGTGLSIEMRVKRGPVTLLSVVQDANGKVKLLCAEGESMAGPILEIGNANSRYKFSLSARDFLKKWSEKGPAHHLAIGIGHVGARLEKIARLLKIEYIKIC